MFRTIVEANEREIEWKFVIRQKKKLVSRSRLHTVSKILYERRTRDELQKIVFVPNNNSKHKRLCIESNGERNEMQVHLHFQWKSILG